MVASLAHRGPDEDGVFLDRIEEGVGVALGHRRLSIIGVQTGRQPIANEDRTIWVVFNGEIYNYRELRDELEQKGHRFRTQADTEVLVHLYEELGPAMLGRLDGMFALAIWDARPTDRTPEGPRLFLARDRLGQKPLYYRHEPDRRLIFGSELKAILTVPGIPREVDPIALDEYLTYQYVPHPRTIYRGVAKLAPGEYAIFADGRLTCERYWQPDFNREENRSESDVIDELRERLTRSVEARLQSEVPLGAFLSGGIDSTIIVGLMQKLSKEPVRTFSIGFPVAEYDESHYAEQVAEFFGTRHETFRVEPDAVGIVDQLIWHYDEPFADSSAIPTWYVSQRTRRHVTVALTGDGGDELFAGYPRYKAVHLAGRFDRLPGPLRAVLASRLWQCIPSSPRQKSKVRQFKRFTEALAKDPMARYLDWISIFNDARRESLYSDTFRQTLATCQEAEGRSRPIDFLTTAAARADRRDPVSRICITDLVTYLPCDLMTKVDIASMAHGLECRQPFLDHHFVEAALAIPAKQKYHAGRGKQILIRAFRDLLPESVVRRPKMGFGVPLDNWFRGPLAPLARDVLLDPRTIDRGYFRRETVQDLVDSHQAGRFDHSYRLWSLLIFELWARRWVDGE
jgi:asparagine synthase (glutamine-hydrolysing)